MKDNAVEKAGSFPVRQHDDDDWLSGLADDDEEQPTERRGSQPEWKERRTDRYVNRKAIGETTLMVLPKRDLSGSAKLVAMALAKRAGRGSCECWPSIRTVCRDVGLSHVAVIRAIKELKNRGYIYTKPGNSERRSNTYSLQWLSDD